MSALPSACLPESKPVEARLTVAKPAGAPPREFPGGGLALAARPLCEIASPSGRDVADLIHSDEDLVVRLCRLPVDLAAPLLRATLPALTPEALLALTAATGAAHHRLIAARPGLDGRVIKALIRTHDDDVMAALIGNPALSFDEEDQLSFARRAQENAGIRTAVLAHKDLPVAQARLRMERSGGAGHGDLRLVALVRGGEAAGFVREMARRLKLDAAGLGRVLASESAVPLALALCAAKLDRAVFLHVLSVWQGAYEAAPRMSEGHRPLVLSVFGLPPAEARRRLAVLIDRAH